MTDVVLRFDRVTKLLDGRPLLRQVSAEFRRGELVIIRPLKGPGRSALTRLLVGQTAPDEGRIDRMGLGAPPPGSAWGFVRTAPALRGLEMRAAAYGVDFDAYTAALAGLMDEPAALGRPFDRLHGRDRMILTFAASWLLPCAVFAIDDRPLPSDAEARARLMPLWRRARAEACILWLARPNAFPRAVTPTRIALVRQGALTFSEPTTAARATTPTSTAVRDEGSL